MTEGVFPDLYPGADRFADLKPAALSPAEKRSLIALALTILAQRHRTRCVLCSPDDTRAYLRLKLAEHKNELFGCFVLDNRLAQKAGYRWPVALTPPGLGGLRGLERGRQRPPSPPG